MTSSAREMVSAVGVVVTDDAVSVELSDGRVVTAPIGWYPRLAHADSEERAAWEFVGGGHGIHWPAVDEDISVAGLLAGRPSGESQLSLQRWLAGRRAAVPEPTSRQA